MDSPLSHPVPSLVHALVDARRSRVQIDGSHSAWDAIGEGEAYAVMLEVARRLGWPTMGWKVAGTNADVQRQLRTRGPVFGRTFERFRVHSPAVLHHAELLDPLVEAEFFFCIGATLAPRAQPWTAHEVAGAIAGACIGIEVAECRFASHRLPPETVLIADGFASGRYVQGIAIDDWQRVLQKPVAVTVLRNGALRARGSSADVMGHPLNAVTWLVNRLGALGLTLRPGEWVSSGSCTGMVRARRHDRVQARFESLGSVCIEFL